MALSIGFRDSVSILLTIQATGVLTFTLVGLPPTEYASLRWTHQHAGLSRRTTKNAGLNYGMLFTAWGVAGIIGPRIGGVLYDKYHNYQAAFYTGAGLAAVALLCELVAGRS